MSFICSEPLIAVCELRRSSTLGWEVQLRADGFLKFGQRFIFREAALKLACELPGPSARRMDGARQSPDASTRIRRPERQPHVVRPGADLPSMAS